MTAAEVGERSGIPEDVIVEKFGLRGKHIAAADEHVSDLCVAAAEKLFAETGIDPLSIDVVMSARSTRSARCSWRCYRSSECAKIRPCTSTTPDT